MHDLFSLCRNPVRVLLSLPFLCHVVQTRKLIPRETKSLMVPQLLSRYVGFNSNPRGMTPRLLPTRCHLVWQPRHLGTH